MNRLPPLTPEIDIPRGWRDGYLDRARLPAPGDSGYPLNWPDPFPHGLQVLAAHDVTEGIVCVVRRVEAGVFCDVVDPKTGGHSLVQIDSLHWWSGESADHPPWQGQGPAPELDWHLELLRQDLRHGDDPIPTAGMILPLAWNFLDSGHSQAVRIWPSLRFGLVTYSAHAVFVGPTRFALVARWTQPPRGVLPWGFGKSWGLLEGVDLRHDDETARRVLLGGLP